MIWNLKDLIKHSSEVLVEVNGEWVPTRPINWRYESWSKRLKSTWAVLTGSAEAFRWPERQ